MSGLNSHQLNVFLLAAETLNFTQAAQRLQISQPSVSQHIQALEEHFGVQLFVRSGRSIEISDSGLALIPLAREMVYLTQHMEETMASLKGDIYGHLVVGCSTSTGRYILPKLLATFHRKYPQVRATCHVNSQPVSLEMLREGTVHLAVVSEPDPIQDFEFQKFACEEIILIAPAHHPWSNSGRIELGELMQADFILPDEGSETHSGLREALARVDLSIYQLKTVITLGSLEAIALSVHEGLGVGFVPSLLMERLVKDKVTRVEVAGLNILRNIYVGRNARRQATTAQKAFWEFLQSPEVLKTLPGARKLTGVENQPA